MNESTALRERSRDLLAQIGTFREHAAGDETPWTVSLGVLEKEIRTTLEVQVDRIAELERSLAAAKEAHAAETAKMTAEADAERAHLEEKVETIRTRISEMERLRDQEADRVRTSMSFKDAELKRLMETVKMDPLNRRRRRLAWGAAAAAAVFAAAVFGAHRFQEAVLWRDKSYPLPYDNPSAATLYGDRLVIADWLTSSLYYHDPGDSLGVRRVVFAPKHRFSGLTAAGRNILAADDWDKKLWTLRFLEGEVADVRSFDSPGPRPMGLSLDEEALWSADPGERAVFKHRPDDPSAVVEKIGTGALAPRAVFRRKGRLWILDDSSGRVYRSVGMENLDKPESWRIVTPGFPPDGPRAVAVVDGGPDLWLVTTRPARVIRYNMRALED